MKRVRKVNAEKYQQLETAVQEKLGQAQQRRNQLEQEQIEKLRSHVCAYSFPKFYVAYRLLFFRSFYFDFACLSL